MPSRGVDFWGHLKVDKRSAPLQKKPRKAPRLMTG